MRLRSHAPVAASPAAAGAVVMGTGIVSVGLSLDGRETLSRVLLVVAALVWASLVASLPPLLVRRRPLLLEHARSAAALTAVAGTNVLGARLSLLGWNREAAAFLAVATVLWISLVPCVLAQWRRPTVGASFLLAVATQSIAALAARLALDDRAAWLVVAALAFLCLGLAFYLLVLASFDLRELVAGGGDHWISGGALAIAALACARCAQAAAAELDGARGSLETAALALWGAAAAWLLVLLLAEIAHPRLAYDLRRWSTVFPLGMYAVCSFAVAAVKPIGGVESFARLWIWVAFGAWLLVLTGPLARLAAARRRG